VSEAIRDLLARPDVRALLGAFADAGAQARIVGGAVRDAVIGRPPGDIDIATPMLPQAVMALAKTRGWKGVPTGLDHGTVTIVISGRPYEVTTLRRDVETDGRRAVVAFTDDFREDAVRRDFTLNAMSLSPNGAVHDYADGVADATAGIIRFMGDAETRIREDYLRILRFFRFQASHGKGPPEPAGLAACAGLKTGLSAISRERVRQELLKLLVAPGAAEAAEAMEAIDLWPHVLAGVAVDAPALRRWVGMARVLPGGRDPMSALAALVGRHLDVSGLSSELRLSRAEAARLAAIIALAPICARTVENPALLREAVYRTGPELFEPALRAAAAMADLTHDAICRARDRALPILADPPVNPFLSADAVALGVAPGPRMGRVLKAAEADWLAHGLSADPAVVAGLLRDAAAATPD
jgi:poly(A) polymerase